MHWAYIASVLLHILAATFWLGGMLFLAIVVVPALRGAPERARLLERMGKLFERASVIALAVLLVTGVVNLLFRGVAQVSDLWSSPALVLYLAMVAGATLRLARQGRPGRGNPTAV
jgi:uncharacterized membrane protein